MVNVVMNFSFKKTPLQTCLYQEDYQNYNAILKTNLKNNLSDLNQENISYFGNETPIHAASVSGNLRAIKSIVNKNGDAIVNLKNNKGFSPLHWASMNGKYDAVQLLLQLGSDPNALTDYEESSLYWATRSGVTKTVELLLLTSKKDVVNFKNKEGFYPLHLCASNGDFDTYKILIAKGANPFVTNKYGATPLHWSCHREACLIDSSQYLGKSKISSDIIQLSNKNPKKKDFLNSINKIGKTALHWACISDFSSIVKDLLTLGCDPTIGLDGFATTYYDAVHGNFSKDITNLIL